MTDTERLNWLETHSASVAFAFDDALRVESVQVHTHETGWITGETVRHAIDRAAVLKDGGGK